MCVVRDTCIGCSDTPFNGWRIKLIAMPLVQDLPQDSLRENELHCTLSLCCAVDWSLAD